MGIKRIKTRSQRITRSGYLKKIQNQKTVASFGYFKKTSQNCQVSRKPEKEEPGKFLGLSEVNSAIEFVIGGLQNRQPAASPASPSPTPQNPRHRLTHRLTELIY
jgi:hypothetical protein